MNFRTTQGRLKVFTFSSPEVMAVLNITPDSFSDGGLYYQNGRASLDACLRQAIQFVEQGAAFIDVGGESTRPGAEPVSVQQELDRVIPVIEYLASELDCVISVDSSSADVMRQAVAAGAGLLNDVRAFTQENAGATAAELDVPVCIMHMQGSPGTMQNAPAYNNVIGDVVSYLNGRIDALVEQGVSGEKIIIDPGFGFGKTLAHNLTLLANLECFAVYDVPVLVGMSRKSMIGQVIGKPVEARLYGGLALAALAADKGAAIVRAHDVAATADVLHMVSAVKKYEIK